MTNSKHFSIKERVEHFKKFYKQENKRPLFGFYIESEYPLFRYKAAENLTQDRPLQPEDFQVKEYLDDCDRLFQLHEDCGGDFIWSGSAFWGIPWLEAALGCPIFADHSTGSIYTKPPENFTGSEFIPQFDQSNPWIKKTEEFLTAMRERSKGRWPLGTTRMRGLSDLLSALYGGEQFVFAMMEKPGEVKRVCKKLTDFWIKYGEFQLQRIPPFYGGVGSFYYNMWAPAGTVWYQEDAAALLSPDLFNEFIRPWDEKIVESFPGCIIHQHPTGYLPTEAYIEMGMTALELHVDEAGPAARELYDRHMQILEEKPLLIWGNLSQDDLDWVFQELPPEGLAIHKVVDSVAEAHHLWEKYSSYLQ